MSKPTTSTYTFREQRRNAQMGGHIYEEKWDCPVFSGGKPEEFLDFWVEFVQVYQRAEWEEDMIFEKICYVLHGSPLRMVQSASDHHPNTITNILYTAYAPKGYEWEFRRRLEEATIGKDESIHDFRERMVQICTYYNIMVNTYGGHQLLTRDLFHYFTKGLPFYFQQKIREHPTQFESIHEAWP